MNRSSRLLKLISLGIMLTICLISGYVSTVSAAINPNDYLTRGFIDEEKVASAIAAGIDPTALTAALANVNRNDPTFVIGAATAVAKAAPDKATEITKAACGVNPNFASGVAGFVSNVPGVDVAGVVREAVIINPAQAVSAAASAANFNPDKAAEIAVAAASVVPDKTQTIVTWVTSQLRAKELVPDSAAASKLAQDICNKMGIGDGSNSDLANAIKQGVESGSRQSVETTTAATTTAETTVETTEETTAETTEETTPAETTEETTAETTAETTSSSSSSTSSTTTTTTTTTTSQETTVCPSS
jgi:hypothetical protein